MHSFFTGRAHTQLRRHISRFGFHSYRAILKKPSHSFDKSAVLYTALKKMAGSGGRAGQRDIISENEGCICAPFLLLCGYFGGWVIRGCFAPWPGSLRCLIVPSYSPWVFGLCAQAQHTHSVRTHRQSVVVSPRSFD